MDHGHLAGEAQPLQPSDQKLRSVAMLSEDDELFLNDSRLA